MSSASTGRHFRAASTASNGLLAARSMTIALSRVMFAALSTVSAAPLRARGHEHDDDAEVDGSNLWVLYFASAILVLSGGAFAGLTIALMGQDGIYLQVVSKDHTEPQQKNAKRVFDLLQRGKHWILVTLLLSNVIVNETLPVVLDRCLGGGVAAVVGSTFLIVIFGEVVPQSVCVRYGLQIGGCMAKPVLVLMWLMAPVAWPTAKLLDCLLGEDHGTVYKKSGLKTLVTLHKSLGDVSERLNQDEVTIISAVLDLKEKPVGEVMTPMEDVFTMAEDTVLDEETMDMILSAGYSRIPIHETGNGTNFVGMLLVKMLITYDPEDARLVREFPLAALPETRPETSCLDIVNFFQEGKSHMVLVSEFPGEDHGALGVITLEDVIEELIGEEIIDESDVYIDVHKAIRRLAPAPKAKVQRRPSEDQVGKVGINALVSRDGPPAANSTASIDGDPRGLNSAVLSSSPKPSTVMKRRSSAGVDGCISATTVSVRTNFDDIKEHLKHLGPSNPASNPKNTTSRTVKIKSQASRSGSKTANDTEQVVEHEDDESTSLLRPDRVGKDGIRMLDRSYGSAIQQVPTKPTIVHVPKTAEKGASQGCGDQSPTLSETATEPVSVVQDEDSGLRASESDGEVPREYSMIRSRTCVRSGSITENVIESRGVRKVVLETNSSNDSDEFSVPATSPDHTKPPSRGNAVIGSCVPEEEGVVLSCAGVEASVDSSQANRQGGSKKSKRKRRKGGKS